LIKPLNIYKKRKTGGKKPKTHKKRACLKHRYAAMTKLGLDPKSKKIKNITVMGGNIKHRALILCDGNFSWASEGFTAKSKILNVIFNPQSNELQRTARLTKRTIVNVDATPFKNFIQT
jgi:small subunit ribosomal protein S8e